MTTSVFCHHDFDLLISLVSSSLSGVSVEVPVTFVRPFKLRFINLDNTLKTAVGQVINEFEKLVTPVK